MPTAPRRRLLRLALLALCTTLVAIGSVRTWDGTNPAPSPRAPGPGVSHAGSHEEALRLADAPAPLRRAKPVRSHEQPAVPSAFPPADVRALVARLRAEAERSDGFHQRARAVVVVLRERCLAGRDTEAAASTETRLAAWLHETLVRDEDESPLVRGAALFAAAPALSTARFRRTFDAWLEAARPVPELLRSAALAASLRGEAVPCATPLALSRLAPLEREDGRAAPASFRPTLRTLLPAYEAGVLEDRLRRVRADERLRLGAPPPMDRATAAEELVTLELFYVLWGHRALVDPVVERRVFLDALRVGGPGAPACDVCVRPALFLAQALAGCDERWAALARDASVSRDPLVAGLSASLEDAGVSGAGSRIVLDFERARSSKRPGALDGLLMELPERLDLLAAAAPEEARLACDYLATLASDRALPARQRTLALRALGAACAWEAFLSACEDCLRPGSSHELLRLALGQLQRTAGDEPSRRAAAGALLERAATWHGDPRALDALRSARERLTR